MSIPSTGLSDYETKTTNSKTNAARAPPYAIPMVETCRIGGFGPTTGWKLIKEGRLQVVRIAGIDRTFVVYDSLMGLLRSSTTSALAPQRRPRGRPRKTAEPTPLEAS
jgi:hypothetical protein